MDKLVSAMDIELEQVEQFTILLHRAQVPYAVRLNDNGLTILTDVALAALVRVLLATLREESNRVKPRPNPGAPNRA